VGSYCVAGADFPSDVRTLERAIGALGLADRSVVRNDAFAALRAGTDSGWGVVVVCGAGVNAVGRGPSGATARLAGIGDLSGDWGGGYGLGVAALGAAVRARDGRGPRTILADRVPRHFGLTRPADVARRLYEARVDARRLEDVAPIVFGAAGDGDAVARQIVDRLADELAVMAIAIARRLHVTRRDVEIVLTGGVFNAEDPEFYGRLTDRVAAALPRARLRRLTAPPVFGSALLGLDMLGSSTRNAFNRLSNAMLAGKPATTDLGR
jgi:N-acetylglucosamine kinase-like BadF-type ATPase